MKKLLQINGEGQRGRYRCEVTTAMPRMAVKVLCRRVKGERLQKDQSLVILEAMKMENEFKALMDSVVTAIKAEGELGGANAVLALLEPEE